MSRYIVSDPAKQDIKEIKNYQIENGIEVERVLSGYRDLEALFLGQEDGVDDDESG